MKIGIISDTHIPGSHYSLPSKIFDIFEGVDLILHAGDLTNLNIIDELETIARVEAVRGNMDGYPNPYPIKKTVTVQGINIGLIHGYGPLSDIRKRVLKEFKNIHIIVYGHSHYPDNEYHNNVLFFNPGSPTDKRHAPYHSVGLIEINDNNEITSQIIEL